MANRQLTEEEKQDLVSAISQLSEEDQMQIAAAGVTTKEQCAAIQRHLPVGPMRTMVAYAAPPLTQRFPLEEFKKSLEEKQKELLDNGDILPKHPGNITE